MTAPATHSSEGTSMRDNFLKDKDIAIVAYAETPLERRSGKSAFDFACAVASELYEKTGLAPKDIGIQRERSQSAK